MPKPTFLIIGAQKCGTDARTANNWGETLVWVHVPEWTH